jgi:hypothetical protein
VYVEALRLTKYAGRSFFRKGGNLRGLVKGKRWLLLSRGVNLDTAKKNQLNTLSALNPRVTVHHMASRLADGITQGAAGPDEFRTAPLWGVGQRLFFPARRPNYRPFASH